MTHSIAQNMRLSEPTTKIWAKGNINDTHSVAEKMRLSEPTTKKMNENRPILSAAKI